VPRNFLLVEDFGFDGDASDCGAFMANKKVYSLDWKPVIFSQLIDTILEVVRILEHPKQGIKLDQKDVVLRLDPDQMVSSDQCVRQNRVRRNMTVLQIIGSAIEEILYATKLLKTLVQFLIPINVLYRSDGLACPL